MSRLGMLVTVGAVALLSSAAGAPARASACVSAPVRYEQAPRADLRFLPWITAGPRGREIDGYLFYYREALKDPRVTASSGVVIYAGGKTPGGQAATKILWAPRRPGFSMVIVGKQLDGSGTFTQRPMRASSGGGIFPSIVVAPQVGCWRLTLRSGRSYARLAVLAIDPN